MGLQVTSLLKGFVAEFATKTQDLDDLVPTKADYGVYLVEGVFSLWVVGPVICLSILD